jgi:hypothetical protein
MSEVLSNFSAIVIQINSKNNLAVKIATIFLIATGSQIICGSIYFFSPKENQLPESSLNKASNA